MIAPRGLAAPIAAATALVVVALLLAVWGQSLPCLTTVLAVLALVFLLGLAFAYRLILPLRAMGASARRISGDPAAHERMPLEGHDEVRGVALAFNQLLDRLEIAFRENRRHQRTLEAALEDLGHSQQRLESHIQDTPVGVIHWTRDFRVEEWNPAAERIFGYDEDAVRGRRALDTIVAPARCGEWKTATQPIWDQEKGVSFLHENLHRDGRPLLCEWHHTLLRDSEGHVTGIASMVQDISERKRAQEAETANRAKSAFLTNMSHELRTPLNAVLGYAQILLKDPDLSEPQRRGLEAIRRGGEFLLTMISDILDLSKIEAGRFELFPTSCDMAAFWEELVELFAVRAAQKGIEFRHEVVALPDALECDGKRLRQVAMNLLSNAIKFTDQGSVTLRVGYDRHLLRLEVEDTGSGIPRDQFGELFKPFSQLGDVMQKQQGTGLGLSITKGLVDAMDGEIEVESAPGRGSCFRVMIPMRVRGPQTGLTARHRPEVVGYRRTDGGGALRVLIVDDLADNREMLASLLGALGFETRCVDNGAKCLMTLDVWPPDAVLMDLRMPEMDGLEATRRLRAMPSHHALPVIAVSASAFGEDLARAEAAGCNGHIPKPVQLSELADLLGRFLPLEWEYRAPRTDLPQGEELSPEIKARLLRALDRGDLRRFHELLAPLTGDPRRGARAQGLLELAAQFRIKDLRRQLGPPAPSI